ncbi:MAG: L,D-transpeptidase family protein [Candidatus Brocadiaceae bacterium]|nr:L,D-transpeptidase family protein [Candidatus Brocadiaceae bacterium]
MNTMYKSFNRVYFFLLLFLLVCSDNLIYSGISDADAPVISRQKKHLLLAEGGEGIIIYKKDIIIHPDEIEAERKKNVEVSDNRENASEKKQDDMSLDVVDTYLKKGDKYGARNFLSDRYLGNEIEQKQAEIKNLLDTLNEELIFSSLPSPDAMIYTVEAGDTLSRIAKKFNINYELIMRINGKPTTRLHVGEKLKILTGKAEILVSKSGFLLVLLLDKHYVKQYPIGIGKNDKTPEGSFEVKNKLKNPTWFSPTGGVFPYGHEENILGTRWIGFKDKPNIRGYGIHGTALPQSIGTASSMGCIRMKNADVEELYDFVTMDTKIVIQK